MEGLRLLHEPTGLPVGAITLLTDELQHLASYGASLDRAGSMPTLCRLAGVRPGDKDSGLGVLALIRGELEHVEGSYEFKGREYPAGTMVEAWAWDLDLSGTEFPAPQRRYQVLLALGYAGVNARSGEWWRKTKPAGRSREWQFLHLLATRLVEVYG
jgi:hypothetical protein